MSNNSSPLTTPPYAKTTSPYGSYESSDHMGATVAAVRPGSPADDAGIEPGMIITHVAGVQLTDMIGWLWESDGETVALRVYDPRDQMSEECVLERFVGEDWGLDFDGAVFDHMRTCVNACVFCFMTMLPRDLRPSLYIRDDDYRLSFLQGNFVTLTNMSDEDVHDAIERHLSPMNVSLHAITPSIRRQLMGKNADRGFAVLEQLMEAGIEIHAQIVVVPGVNDKEELQATLDYAEQHPLISSMGIVPLGYTRFQKRFNNSFSDNPEQARDVIHIVEAYQRRARTRYGRTIYQLSDEFYLDAHVAIPPAEFYDGYPQYYDGIGMLRSYMDDTDELLGDIQRMQQISEQLRSAQLSLVVLSGAAAAPTVARFVESSLLGGRVIAITNTFFGGNVDVTGLICGCDILEQLDEDLHGIMLIVPEVIFNADGLTLDGYHRDQLASQLTARGSEVCISSTMPHELTDLLETELGMLLKPIK